MFKGHFFCVKHQPPMVKTQVKDKTSTHTFSTQLPRAENVDHKDKTERHVNQYYRDMRKLSRRQDDSINDLDSAFDIVYSCFFWLGLNFFHTIYWYELNKCFSVKYQDLRVKIFFIHCF